MVSALSTNAIDFVDTAFLSESAPPAAGFVSPAANFVSTDILEGPPAFLEAQGVRYVPAPLAVAMPSPVAHAPPAAAREAAPRESPARPLSVSARVSENVRSCMAACTDLGVDLHPARADRLSSAARLSSCDSSADRLSRGDSRADRRLKSLYAEMLESDRRASHLAARASEMSRPRAALNAAADLHHSDSEGDSDESDDHLQPVHAAGGPGVASGYCAATKPVGRQSHLTTCW